MDTADPNTLAWLEAIRTISSRRYCDARRLLREDQDVNVRGPGGVTALHVAVRRASDKIVHRLLLDGADHTVVDDNGQTPLRIAQRLQHSPWMLTFHDVLVQALTTHLGRTPSKEDVYAAMKHNRMRRFKNELYRRWIEDTELSDAAHIGDLVMVRSIMERGDRSIDVLNGGHAFAVALRAGHLDVCEYLINNGAHVYEGCQIGSWFDKKSTLVTAVQLGDEAFIRQLMAHWGPLYPSLHDKKTSPLAEAVKMGSITMIDTLLELGFRAEPGKHGVELPWPVEDVLDLDAGETEEETPWWLLALACWHQNRRLIHDLITTQDALRRRDLMAKRGASALVLSVFKHDLEMASDLLNRGVLVNECTKSGLSAMATAAVTNSVAMLKMLSDRGGTRIGTLPSASRSLEGVLSSDGCPVTIDMLLSCYTTSSQDTYELFREACGSQDVDTVSVFLAHGYSAYRSHGFRSALMMALLQNFKYGISAARLLLESGASLTTSASCNLSPLAELEIWSRYSWGDEKTRFFEAGRELLIEFGAC